MEELGNMCRACSMEIDKKSDLSIISEFNDETPINVLKNLFPDLKLCSTMASDYKLCIECLSTLIDCKNFKQMIVETENQLKKFLNEMILAAGNCRNRNTYTKPQIAVKNNKINNIQCSNSPILEKCGNDLMPNSIAAKSSNAASLLRNSLSVASTEDSNSNIGAQVSNIDQNEQIKLKTMVQINERSINNSFQVMEKAPQVQLIGEKISTYSNDTVMSPYEKLCATYDAMKTAYVHCKVLVVLNPVVKFTFGCEQCDKIFPKKHLLAEHLTFHDKERRGASDLYECFMCNKTFDNLTDFKSNEYRCSRELRKPSFACRYCDRLFRTHGSFRLHEPRCFESQTDKPKMPYMCSICGKAYDYHFACCAHERNHRYHLREIACNFCDKEFELNVQLDAHVAVHHISCTICACVLDSRDKFEDHMHEMHGLKVHECDVCNKRFVRREALVTHHRDYHSGQQSVCEYCGKTFKAKPLMKSHIENVHRKTDRKLSKHKCLHCEREFKTATLRKCHTLRVHEPEKLLQCEYCPARKPLMCYLKKHIRVAHSKIRQPVTCTICGTTLSQANGLRRHMKIHTGADAQRSCKYCEQTFADGIFYRAHLQQFHKDRFVRCSLCPAAFQSGKYLLKHMRQKHKVT